jgi:uncharacterized protein (TIGR02145 family)
MKSDSCFANFLVICVLVNLNSFFFKTEAQTKGEGVSDIEGNNYLTVIIGKQEWMVTNLKTTKLNDGNIIPNITVDAEWSRLSGPGCSWYGNDISNKNVYGALYNWFAVNTGKLCPVGWHVPSDAEWAILVNYLGGNNVAGGKLKETGTKFWLSPNEGATNESGFSGLASGNRNGFKTGPFHQIGYYCDWWSTSQYLAGTAWSRRLHFNTTTVTRNNGDLKAGYSVRCLKN